MKALLAHACEVWELTDSALRGNGRHHAISRPRQVLYWFAHDRYGMSLSSIARNMGRDHTTIISGVRNINRRKSYDKAVMTWIAQFDEGKPSIMAVFPPVPERIEVPTASGYVYNVTFNHDPTFIAPPEVPDGTPLWMRRPAPVNAPVIRRPPALCATRLPGPVEIAMPNRMAAR